MTRRGADRSLRNPVVRRKALEMYIAGGTMRGVARALGLERTVLRPVLRREGIARPYPPPEAWAAARRRAIAAYVAGASAKDAARDHHVGGKALLAALKNEGKYRPSGCKHNAIGLRNPEVRLLLGKVPDVLVAYVLGCAPKTVRRYRRSLGTAPYRRPRRVPRTVSLDAPLLFNSSAGAGGSFHDILKDGAWAEWLEESGATVW